MIGKCFRVSRVLLAVAAMAGGSVAARDGDLANGFGAGGVQRVAFDVGGGLNDQAFAMAVQGDGRILLAGLAESSSDYDFAIARLTTAGVLDSSFGTGGKVRIDFGLGGFDDSVQAVIVMPDGRIVVVGRVSFDGGGGPARYAFGVARLSASGSPDLSFDLDGRTIVDFDPGGTLSADPYDAIVEADGKVVIAGALVNTVGADIAIARLNADGSPDTSLNGTGRKVIPLPTTALPQALARRPTGEYVLAGALFDAGLTTADMLVVQLQQNGELDGTFGPGGYRQVPFDQGGNNLDIGRALAIDSLGKIVVAGNAAVAASGTAQDLVAAFRLSATGALDSGFGTGGRVLIPIQRAGVDLGGTANGVVIDSQGRIVLAGRAGTSGPSNDDDVAFVRLTSGGTLDESFGQAGRRLVAVDLGPPGNQTDTASAVAIDPGGRIVSAGLTFIGSSLNFDMLAVALVGDTIFADGFD